MQKIVWQPQPGRQKALIDCPLPYLLYGGARGGGKTDGILGKFAIKGEYYKRAFNAVFFRKEMPQQDDLIERAKEIYLPIGAQWQDQKKTFTLPSGGRIRFRPLESNADAEKYQGQNISDAAVEEAGSYPDSSPIDKLFGCLRSKTGVPIQLILSANPGGAGHAWIKQRFIDPAPLGMKVLQWKVPTGNSVPYCYIPSKIQDNKIMMLNDPSYVDRLHLSGSPELVRAWLEGDWNVIQGAYFPEFRIERHVVKPKTIPTHWLRFQSFDWGSYRPFSVGWWTVASEDTEWCKKGCLVRYREWYGSTGVANQGLKYTVEQVAHGIKEREFEKINYRTADPSIFKHDGGVSIAERFENCGIRFEPSDNSRLAGWEAMRSRLLGDEGHPMSLVFSTCTDSIRTIPAQQHDDRRPEELDSDGEDHIADEWRYAHMSRPWIKPTIVAPEPMKSIMESTLNDMFKSVKYSSKQRIKV
jgi:hypothetical protein